MAKCGNQIGVKGDDDDQPDEDLENVPFILHPSTLSYTYTHAYRVFQLNFTDFNLLRSEKT